MASEAPSHVFVSGARLGEYVIEGLLGVGGMARVFAARRQHDGHRVAIKHFPSSDPAQLFRFKREFRALADVRHDNLIALGELTVLDDGQAYFTMERILGRPFVEWVRRDLPVATPPNPARLRRAMRQLVAGTTHLHQAGFVHRDLKPSNVLITDEGRVVILDFGLIREFTGVGQTWTREGQTIGTPNYMAPEQIGDGSIGPAADWYAVGVMLFECLTGTRPFAGSPVEVLMAKLDERTPNPASSLCDLPEPLVMLCRQLLASEPSERPSGEQLLGWFAEPDLSGPSVVASAGSRRSPSFVGRAAELDRLRDAHAAMRAGRTVSVHVQGPEGLGKTALVEHFLTELESAELEHTDEPTILRSRCHERESVPYKGVDGLVDALSLRLRHLSELEAAALQPRHLGALTRLFPVLGDVWPHRGRAAPEGEPREVRRLGIAALREVLIRLGDRGPLILWIDDFHWADVDSVRLLDQLLRPPDSPTLLLLVGSRSGEHDSAALWVRSQEQIGRSVPTVELAPLPSSDIRMLATALAPEASAAHLDALVERSDGNPFALVQLAHAVDEPAVVIQSDHGIARRILALGPAARQVVAALAVAGRPLPRSALVRLQPDAELELRRLARLGLVEVTGEWAAIEPARIREVALAELSSIELRELHGQLGELLVELGIESEALVDHFEQAGQLARAARLASATAEQAALALAFDRAAAGFRRALRLAPADTPIADLDVLRRQLAEQLVHLGHTIEAAALLLDVASRLPSPAAHELRGRAARLLVYGRRIDQALPLLAEQLAAVGERLPTGKVAMIAMVLWNRTLVSLRGYRFRVRSKHEIDEQRVNRIETLQTVAMALATSGHLSRTAPLVFALRARVLRLALNAGDPRSLAAILAIEAMLCATRGNVTRADSLIADAERLVGSLALPELECEIEYLHASVDWLTFRWIDAETRLARLAVRVEDSNRGGGWMRALILRSRVHIRVLLGDIAEVRRRTPGERATLREIGNNLEVLEYGLKATMVQLYDGEYALAERAWQTFIDEFDAASFTYQHVSMARLEIEIALFTGDVARACTKLEATIAEARRHDLYQTRIVRLLLEDLRARTLALALLEAPEADGIRRRLRRSIRQLAATRLPMFQATAANAEAVLHELEARPERALAARRRALDGYARAGMRAHEAATGLRLAALGGEPQWLDRARAYFETEAIVGWRRVVEVMAPSGSGVPNLDGSTGDGSTGE
jgi:serine/threonine protein kinase